MGKIALVIEGGGMRGAFFKGVLDSFKENNIKFPYVVGVSAGAITGFEFVTGIKFDINKLFLEFAKNMDILKSTSEPIVLKEYINSIFAFPDINEKINTQFEVSAVSLDDGNIAYFSLEESKSVDDMVDKIIASSSLPDMARPVEIEKKLYYDGGMYNTNPIDRAIELGYDKFVVLLARNRGYRRESSEATDFVKNYLKKYPKFLETMKNEKEEYNKSMDLIDVLEKEGKAIVYAPEKLLKFKTFTTNFQDMMDLYIEGKTIAYEKMNKLKEFMQELK